MCGICGVVGHIDEPLLRRMTRTMVHRGPDDEDLYLGEGVGLGVRRLSIIDLAGGRQPIANEDGTIRVVFNGEIYNYQSLRDRLEKQGHRFTTNSDTEVLVHLYEEYGDAGVHLLRGMFAYALWDGRQRRLLLVRDRVGIKPLYYAEAGGSLLFASEAKALFVHPALTPEADIEALDLYLTFQYVPGPRTLFRGVHKLLPGHLLVMENNRVEIHRYWDVVFGEGERGIDLDDAAEEFRHLFDEAVRLHLVSDVPVGALLSGGIDSSSVVALMAEAAPASVQTFTVGFDMPGMHNELADARLVAKHFRTDHHEIVTAPDTANLLPKLIWHLDEPIADPAALPTYHLCRFAHQTVPVVLTGEGGDELLGGYPRYAWFLMAKRLQQLLPAEFRERVLLPLGRMITARPRYRKALEDVLAERDDASRHLRWIANFDDALKARVVSPDLRADLGGKAEALVAAYLDGGSPNPGDLVHRLIALDMHTWLVDDILTKMDKMSMATSVEARVPFLDHHLVEFVAALPVSLKIRTLGTKQLLRHTMCDFLPPHTLARRKHAFLVPVDQWLRGPLRDFLRETLLTERARQRGWLDPTVVEAMVDAHRAGTASYGQQIWNLLCLELWARVFLDGRGREP
jgi:asparagine synthase (glutamine-hydrolysing)